MSVDERRLRCFIASPSDCFAERKIAAAAVQRIDRLVGRFVGIRLEPVSWEGDAFPDIGRPQEIINDILDVSDIAIFLFWHRLGTDAGRGLTGAEEEFYRTLERRYTSGQPRILLYFNEAALPDKAVDLDQLGRLRNFRARIDAGRHLLYGTFKSPAELKERLEDALADELFRRYKAGGPTSGPPASKLSGGEKPAPKATGSGPTADAEGDIEYLIDTMIRNLTEQSTRLEISGHDPKTLAHLKTEIERLHRLRDQKP